MKKFCTLYDYYSKQDYGHKIWPNNNFTNPGHKKFGHTEKLYLLSDLKVSVTCFIVEMLIHYSAVTGI